MRKTTLAVIVGNRDFFPDALCDEGRKTMLRVLAEEGFEAICLGPEDTKGGSIETYADAKQCADLFAKNASRIDGVLITLPNFGDEKAVANALRLSGLNVPILVQAFPDDLDRLTVSTRRDSFCGKVSVCHNLRQYGYSYTLTEQHTIDPESPEFRAELQRFGAVCRVVRGLKGLRLGSIGARPGGFNTVRYSEKLLEQSGISVETVDLSEIIGKAQRLADDNAQVKEKLAAIGAYVPTAGVPDASLVKMAKLGVTVESWMKANDLNAAALQCWTAIEEFYGVVPCTIMSMLSNSLIPCACEVDVTGALSMFILQQAAGRPSALVDWNNNYGSDPNKGVIFHCSNLPKDVFEPGIQMEYPPILASTLGQANTYGVIAGRIKASAMTYGRVSTDDFTGKIKVYVGEGRMTDDPLNTFGGRGVLEVPNFQKLLQYICRNGFEHHVAVNLAPVAGAVTEALGEYLKWDVYQHGVQ